MTSNMTTEAPSNVTTLAPPVNVTFPEETCVRRILVDGVNTTTYFYHGYEGIPENLTFCFIIWLILMAIFIVVRRITLGKARDQHPTDNFTESLTGCVQVYFGWIVKVFKLKDEDISNKCGRDALLYLVVQRYLIFYLIIVTVISVAIILPVNYHGTLLLGSSAFGMTTMGNLDPRSPAMWLHAIAAFLYLILAVVFMKRIKKLYMLSRRRETMTRTLILTNLPAKQTTDKTLVEYFRENFQETFIESFNFAYNVKWLNQIFEKRKQIHELKQMTEERCGERGHPEDMCAYHCCDCCGCCGKCGCGRVDALEHYSDEERRLTATYHRLLSRVLGAPLDVAFVTFSTHAMAQRIYHFLSQPCGGNRYRCRYCWLGGRPPVDVRACGVMLAPEPEDIYWHNLSEWRPYWWMKAVTLNLLLCLLLLFFTTPSVILNTLSELGVYRALVSGFGNTVVVNVLPVLLLLLFSILLPWTIIVVEGFMAHWTRSKEQKVIMIKAFIFLLLMVIILPALGLTSAKALFQWLFDKDNGESMRWRCIFLPDSGAFFVNYIISAGLIGTAIQLLRLTDLLVLGMRLMAARSQAETTMAWKQLTGGVFQYGAAYAWLLVNVCVVIVFSVCVPLITPFGLFYLCLKHFVDRHNLYFAYRPSRMTSEPHRRAINFVYTGAILLQFVVMAYTWLRSGGGRPPAPAIMSCIVFGMAIVYVTTKALTKSWTDSSKSSNVKDKDQLASTLPQFTYIPEVILWGTSPESVRRVPPVVSQHDI